MRQGERISGGVHAYLLSVSVFSFKLHSSVNLGKEGVILTHPDIVPRVYLCSKLTYYNRTGRYGLPAVYLNPAPLCLAVSPVARTSLAFLVSHSTFLH